MAVPGSGIAKNDRRKYPPQSSEGFHTSDEAHWNGALVTMTNNLYITRDGHDTTALIDSGADYSVLSGKLSSRLGKVMTPWNGTARLFAALRALNYEVLSNGTGPSGRHQPRPEVVHVVCLKPYYAR